MYIIHGKKWIRNKKQITFMKILLIFAFASFFLFGCSDYATPHSEGKKDLPDSVFFLTFERAAPLKIPCEFKNKPSESQLVKLNFVPNFWDTIGTATDSLFLFKYISDFDNFFQFRNIGWDEEYSLYQGIQWNDSIYLLTYFDNEVIGSSHNSYLRQPKVILLTFNVNQSVKPAGKLILFGYQREMFELSSKIDSEFNVESLHYMSLKGHYEQFSDYGPNEYDLFLNIRKYRLKANGQFEQFFYLTGRRRGVQKDGEHFRFSENDTVILHEIWEKDSKLSLMDLAKKEAISEGFVINYKFKSENGWGGN